MGWNVSYTMKARLPFWLALAFALGCLVGTAAMWPQVSAWQALALDALDVAQQCVRIMPAPRTTL